MSLWSLITVALVLALGTCHAYQQTELDAYVRQVDAVFGWQNTHFNFSFFNQYTAYVYNLTSLQYLTEKETDKSVWTHSMIYVVPTVQNKTCDSAFLWLTWGSNKKPWETQDDIDMAVLSQVAVSTGCPAVGVFDIPNQPICWINEPDGKYCGSEDSALAYSFNRYLYHNKSADWNLLFPMTKAGVRAMDAVQEIAKQDFGQTISTFTVSGASKRGWTTWLVGAVDYKNRISAIVPVVLDALNFGDFLHRQWRSYKGFTFALGPYWEQGLTRATALPRFQTWLTEVDPYQYRERLTMPKFAVNAVGDEFQLLDDQAHWAHDLPGEMKTILIKDADHVLVENFGLVVESVRAFTRSVVMGVKRPSYTWSIDAQGQITVVTSEPPLKVSLIYATVNTTNRDFRYAVLNLDPCIIHVMGACLRFVFWTSSNAIAVNSTTFKTNMAAPSFGWTGFYLQVEFADPAGGSNFVFASPASVLPLGYPYADCQGVGCNGTLV